MATRKAGTTGTTTRKRATATTRRGSARQQAEEYEEVKGSSGDFPAMWDFAEQGDLVGTFRGTVTREIKGEDRTIHQFEVDGDPIEAWGAAILDSRLLDVDPGTDVKVVKSGEKIKTKGGRSAWEFKVFVKRGALKGSRR